MDFGMMEIKRVRNKAGDTTIKGNGNFDATGKLKTIKKNPSAVEILKRMENEKKTAKKIEKQEISKTKETEVKVADLEKEFSGILTTDRDKNNFCNFRIGRNIQFYATDRAFGIALSTRTDKSKSGWQTERITNAKELADAVDTLKTQVKYQTALIPIFRCSCGFEAKLKTDMQAHIKTHTSQVD